MNYSIEIIRLGAVILITFTHIRHSFESGYMYVFLEQVPLYGTLILSIISGFLYTEVSAAKPFLLKRKVKSLLIPFLIANFIVIILAYIAHIFEMDVLNRLEFNRSLITTGLFALDGAPFNPPTYFIRDIFIIFVMLESIRNKNYVLLIGIICLSVFGELLLRYDILILFVVGMIYSKKARFIKGYKIQLFLITIMVGSMLFLLDSIYSRHVFSMALFLMLIDWKVSFKEVGGYSYTLHLYHSPIIVVSYPFLIHLVDNPYILVFLQVSVASGLCFIGYSLIKRLNLQFMIGGR